MPEPLYQQVITDLENKIAKAKPNDKLPSERQLLLDYGVSRNTIRLALKNLEERGLIYRLHGKGTFVASSLIDQPNIGGMYSFSEVFTRAGYTVSAQNQSLELVRPNQHIANQLNLHTGERAYQFTRLRLVNDAPRILSTTYLPENLFPEFKLDDLEGTTLYGVLKQKYHQIGVMAFEDVQAISLNVEESNLLKEQIGAPCLKIFRRTINDRNVPIEYTISLARGDKFIYRSRQYNNLI